MSKKSSVLSDIGGKIPGQKWAKKILLTDRGRPRRWLVVFFVLYMLYVLSAALFLPPVLKPYVVKELSKALQAECTINKISYNPITFTLRATGLNIPYPSGGPSFLTVKELELSPGLDTFLRFAPALGHLRVIEPRVHIVLERDGRVSLMQFVEQPAIEPTPPADEGPLFPFIVNNIEIVDGSITVDDQLHQVTHTVEHLMVSVPFASTLQTDVRRAVRPTMNATVNNRFFAVEGATTPFAKSQRTAFKFEFGEVPLKQLQPYLTPYTTLAFSQGTVAAEVSLQFEKTEQGMNTGVAGLIHLNNLSITAPQDGEVLRLQYGLLEVEQLLFSLEQLVVNKLILDQPHVMIGREKSGDMSWQKYIRATPLYPTAPVVHPPEVQPASGGTRNQKNTAAQPNASPSKNSTAASRSSLAQKGSKNLSSVGKNATQSSVPAHPLGAFAAVVFQEKFPFLQVNTAIIRDGTVTWADATPALPVLQVFSPLNFQLQHLSTAPGKTAVFSLAVGKDSVASRAQTEAFFKSYPAADFIAVEDMLPPQIGKPASGGRKEAGKKPVDTESKGKVAGSIPIVNASNATASSGMGKDGDGITHLPAQEGQSKVSLQKAQPLVNGTKGTEVKPSPSAVGAIALRGVLDFTKGQPGAPLSAWRLQTHLDVDNFPLLHLGKYLSDAGVAGVFGSLGAKISLGVVMEGDQARLRMTNGSLSVHNFMGMTPKNLGTGTFSIQEIALHGIGYHSSPPEVELHGLSVVKPSLTLMLTGPPAAKSGSSSSASKQKANKEQPLVVTVKDVSLSQGQMNLRNDKAQAVPLRLENVQINASDISTRNKQTLKLSASSTWNTSGKAAVSGSGTVLPLNLQFNTTLDAVPLQSLSPWIKLVSTLEVARGTASCEVSVQVADKGIQVQAVPKGKVAAQAKRRPSAKEGASKVELPEQSSSASSSGIGVAVAGKASLDNLLLQDNKQNVLAFSSLKFFGIRANTAAQTYDVGGCVLEAPKLNMVLFRDGMNSFSRAFDVTGEKTAEAKRAMAKKAGAAGLEAAIKEAEAEAQKKGQVDPLLKQDAPQGKARLVSRVPQVKRLSIGKFLIRNGAVEVRDETLPRRARINIVDIEGQAEGLNSERQTQGTMQLSAKVEGASLHVVGQGTPLFAPLKGNATIVLKGMDMLPLSPYAEKFTDYPIEKGALSLDIALKTDGVILNAANGIFLQNMALGKKLDTPGAPSMPIKTGLALLADSSGNITLSLPIRGRLDDPQLRTGGVVTKAFGNLFFKVMFSPFTLLGSVFGSIAGGDTDLQFIAFEPGDDRITAQSAKSVAELAKLLQKSAKLTVALTGVADEGERQVLAQAFIRKGLQEEKWNTLSRSERKKIRSTEMYVDQAADPSEYEKLLFELYRNQSFDKPSVLGITKKQPVPTMLDMIIRSVATTDEALEQLGLRRAESVRQELIALDPSLEARVTVVPTGKLRSAAKGQGLFSRVELSVK